MILLPGFFFADHDSPDMIEAALHTAVQQGTSADLCLQWYEIASEITTDSGLKELLLAIQTDFFVRFFRHQPYGTLPPLL